VNAAILRDMMNARRRGQSQAQISGLEAKY
jgi:hypothetical protein